MPGDEQLTQQKEKQQIAGTLSKMADKLGSLKMSPEKLVGESRQYEKNISRATRFMSILGIKKLFHSGARVNSVYLNQRLEKQNEWRTDAEKEQSYQLKASKQEEAAKRRGEYSGDFYSRRYNEIKEALDEYNADKSAQAQSTAAATAVQDPGSNLFYSGDGEEFHYLLLKSKDEVVVDLRDCMKGRDGLKEKIAYLEKDDSQAAKIYVRHLRNLLACTEDALNTFYHANGLSLDNGQVTDKMKQKAKEHLPLALEKYRFYAKNYDRLFGEELIREAKKSKEWEQERKRIFEGVPEDDSLKTFIADHPEKYHANKKQIDQAFARYTQCMRKIREMSVDIQTGTNLFANIQGSLASISRHGLAVVDEHNAYMTNVLEYQAESAEAYIKYLLTGEKVDVMHGEYIEKTWGVKVSEQDTSAPLEKTLEEYKEVDRKHKARIQSLESAITTETDPVRLKVLRDALKKLKDQKMGSEPKSCIERGHDLSLTDEHAVEAVCLREKVFGDRRYEAFLKEPAIEGMVNALSPVDGAPQITEEDLRLYGNSMAIVISGKDMDGNKVEKKGIVSAYVRLLGVYLDQAEEVMKYARDNPEVVAERHSYNAMRNWSKIPRFSNKAIDIAAGLQNLIRSPVFSEFPSEDQKQLVETYEEIYAMGRASDALLSTISRRSLSSAEEYASRPVREKDLHHCSVDYQRRQYHEYYGQSYLRKSCKRSFRAILPAQGQTV